MHSGSPVVSVPKSVHEYWRFACFCYEECARVLKVRLFVLGEVYTDIGSLVVCASKSVHA